MLKSGELDYDSDGNERDVFAEMRAEEDELVRVIIEETEKEVNVIMLSKAKGPIRKFLHDCNCSSWLIKCDYPTPSILLKRNDEVYITYYFDSYSIRNMYCSDAYSVILRRNGRVKSLIIFDNALTEFSSPTNTLLTQYHLDIGRRDSYGSCGADEPPVDKVKVKTKAYSF